MLDLVREYAGGMLTAEERGLLEAHHARAYLSLAEREAAPFAIGQPHMMARLGEELHNLRRAGHHMRSAGEPRFGALRLVLARFGHLSNTGLFHEGLRDLHSSWDDAAPGDLRAQALIARSVMEHGAGRNDEATATSDRDLARELDDPGHEGILLGYRCLARLLLGDVDESVLADVDRSIELARKSGATGMMAQPLQIQGNLLRATQSARARQLLEEALRLSRLHEPPGVTSSILRDLAFVDHEEGRYDEAIAHATEGLTIAEQVPLPLQIACFHMLLGYARYRLGELDEAVAELDRCLRLNRLIGQVAMSIQASVCLGYVEAGRDQFRAARCLGIAQGCREREHYTPPPWQTGDLDVTTKRLRLELGDEAFDSAYEAGRALSYDDAVTYLLDDAPLPARGSTVS
jgi:tetratricopeptide (TPR) repeat protein